MFALTTFSTVSFSKPAALASPLCPVLMPNMTFSDHGLKLNMCMCCCMSQVYLSLAKHDQLGVETKLAVFHRSVKKYFRAFFCILKHRTWSTNTWNCENIHVMPKFTAHSYPTTWTQPTKQEYHLHWQHSFISSFLLSKCWLNPLMSLSQAIIKPISVCHYNKAKGLIRLVKMNSEH